MPDLGIIKELMGQLKSEMKYGKKDLAHRLGRKDEEDEEPEVKVVRVEGALPRNPAAAKSIRAAFIGDEDDEDEGPMQAKEPDDEEESLKDRLMRLRG